MGVEKSVRRGIDTVSFGDSAADENIPLLISSRRFLPRTPPAVFSLSWKRRRRRRHRRRLCRLRLQHPGSLDLLQRLPAPRLRPLEPLHRLQLPVPVAKTDTRAIHRGQGDFFQTDAIPTNLAVSAERRPQTIRRLAYPAAVV